MKSPYRSSVALRAAMYGLGFIAVAIAYLLLSVYPQLRWWNVCGTVIGDRRKLATLTLVTSIRGIVSGSALRRRDGIIRSCLRCCPVAYNCGRGCLNFSSFVFVFVEGLHHSANIVRILNLAALIGFRQRVAHRPTFEGLAGRQALKR